MLRKILFIILCLTIFVFSQDEFIEQGDLNFLWLAELLDAEIYPSAPDVIYVVGVGGYKFIDVSDLSNPQLIGRYNTGSLFKRFYNGVAEGDIALGAARLDGIYILNIANLSNPFLLKRYQTSEYSYESVELNQNFAYAAAHGNGVEVIDISTPSAPFHVTSLTGLENAWDVFIDGNYLYVADGPGGLKIFSIAQPQQPQFIASISTSGYSKEVIVENGIAYVAAGAAGFDMIDISDPATPQFINNYNSGFGITNHLAFDNNIIFNATWELVEAIDVTDPANAVLLGTEDTPQRAMGIAAKNGEIFVTDWSRVRTYTFSQEIVADIHIKPTVQLFGYQGNNVPISKPFRIFNLGEIDLDISDIHSNKSEYTISPTNLTVSAGASGTVTATFRPENQGTVGGALTFVTNDPDESGKVIQVVGGEPGLSPGDPAPNFTLPDLNGVPHTLSSYLGKVVILTFFASW